MILWYEYISGSHRTDLGNDGVFDLAMILAIITLNPIVSDIPVYVLIPRTGGRFKGKMTPMSFLSILF